MAPMSAEWPDPRPGGTATHVAGLTDALPRPWGAILGAMGVLQYALLTGLGVYSTLDWWPAVLNGEVGPADVGVAAAVTVAVFGAACAVTKAKGWWQAEWVLLWFLMAGLFFHVIVAAATGGWPEWVLAQTFFLAVCAARCLSLLLFAKRARWGADRRHLIQRPLRRPGGAAA